MHVAADLADDYGKFRTQAAEIEEKLSHIRDELIALNRPIIAGKKFTVKVEKNYTVPTLDVDRLGREKPQILKQYRTETPSVKLRYRKTM